MPNFSLPPLLKNPKGDIRKAGFEIEHSGLTPLEDANIIKEIFGGEIFKKSKHQVYVKNSLFGDFAIYLDSKFLLDFERSEYEQTDFLRELLLDFSEIFIPYEIVTPPIPFDKLDFIEKLREKLKENGALGTDSSFVYAFGLHINVEAASYEVEYILNILRAFLILFEWIKEKNAIDLTRKLSWFIEPFNKEYILYILNLDYKPNLKKFIEDYIFYNPTRNKALDLLPLLAYLDKRVKELLPEEKINPRPAFHYRLPNSRIDEEWWSIAYEFNFWTLIEKVAYEKELTKELSEKYIDFLESPLWFISSLWVEEVEKTLSTKDIKLDLK